MNRPSAARRVAFAGLLTALTLALLYLLYVLPTMKLGVLFVLSALPVTLACERRYADGLLSFAGAALLSGLLFPAQGAWVLYTAFFGWYGIAREAVVTRFRPVVAWPILLVLFNTALAAVWFIARETLLSTITLPVAWLLPAAEVAFILYELLFTQVRAYYLQHLRRHLFHS